MARTSKPTLSPFATAKRVAELEKQVASLKAQAATAGEALRSIGKDARYKKLTEDLLAAGKPTLKSRCPTPVEKRIAFFREQMKKLDKKIGESNLTDTAMGPGNELAPFKIDRKTGAPDRDARSYFDDEFLQVRTNGNYWGISFYVDAGDDVEDEAPVCSWKLIQDSDGCWVLVPREVVEHKSKK